MGKNNTCSNVGDAFKSECDPNYHNPVYAFKGFECFKDDVYFGKIVSMDDETVKVQIDNGNKYMQGQVITFTLHPTKQEPSEQDIINAITEQVVNNPFMNQ